MTWVRPHTVPLGQVWRKFKGRERNGEPAKMYQVRDASIDTYETILELMKETFLRDEPLCQVFDLKEDEESVDTVVNNWLNFLSQNVSLACFTEVDGRPDQLVGFNILTVKTKDEEEPDINTVKGEAWRQLLKTLTVAEELVDIFKYYDIDTFMTSSGLTVLPEHRGQNIGAEIFAAREPLCKALGIKATATVFTATTSQVLAAKCGFKELAVLQYSDMKQHGVEIENCTTPCAKLMGKLFE